MLHPLGWWNLEKTEQTLARIRRKLGLPTMSQNVTWWNHSRN